jgi:glucose-6-phosphate 1-dehydrogenase
MEGGREINGHGVELLVSETATIDDLGAYERVLGDALAGDPGVFAREDYVEEAWRIVDPVLQPSSPPASYVPGTWGPQEKGDLTPPWGWVNPAGARQSVQG